MKISIITTTLLLAFLIVAAFATDSLEQDNLPLADNNVDLGSIERMGDNTDITTSDDDLVIDEDEEDSVNRDIVESYDEDTDEDEDLKEDDVKSYYKPKKCKKKICKKVLQCKTKKCKCSYKKYVCGYTYKYHKKYPKYCSKYVCKTCKSCKYVSKCSYKIVSCYKY